MSRYTVWSVGRDGNVLEHLSFDVPREAIEFQEALRFVSPRLVFGITDNENPEAGDVSDRLAEEVSK